jgi:hypothetical protein
MSATFDKPIVSPILAGRGPELETLKHALTNAQQGTGQCFILEANFGPISSTATGPRDRP